MQGEVEPWRRIRTQHRIGGLFRDEVSTGKRKIGKRPQSVLL